MIYIYKKENIKLLCNIFSSNYIIILTILFIYIKKNTKFFSNIFPSNYIIRFKYFIYKFIIYFQSNN